MDIPHDLCFVDMYQSQILPYHDVAIDNNINLLNANQEPPVTFPQSPNVEISPIYVTDYLVNCSSPNSPDRPIVFFYQDMEKATANKYNDQENIQSMKNPQNCIVNQEKESSG